MSTQPIRTDAKTFKFPRHVTLWGEIPEEQQHHELRIRTTAAREREEEPQEEEFENRGGEEAMEVDEDDDDEDDDEGDEASGDEEEVGRGPEMKEQQRSATMGRAVRAEEARGEGGGAAGQSGSGQQQPGESSSSTGQQTELPLEIEALIRTAYKPEGPKVIFPIRINKLNDTKEEEEIPYEYCRTNDIVHHTIRLNQHFRIMSALLHIAQNTKGTEFRKFPPIPDMVIRKRKVKRYKKFRFTVPINQHPRPYLERNTIQKMLQKAVVIILAQLGVDKATKSVILVLVDVVKEYLRKMCLMCNTYCQWDLSRGHMDFRAVMHRTLIDMGLRRGQEDIKEYCENMVKRRNRAFRRTFHLVRLYLKTVYAARMRARLLGTPTTSSSSSSGTPSTSSPTSTTSTGRTSSLRPYNARTMLPHQGLSVYLPRGMQTITVMERGRPFVRKMQNLPTSAPAPMLASRFEANLKKKKDLPPQLSAILRPTEDNNQ